MTYLEQVKSLLGSDIATMAQVAPSFSKNPPTDFSRDRKIPFEKWMQFFISMGNDSTNHELLKYFNYDLPTPTTSAICKQREKILPKAFLHLLKQFNSPFPLSYTEGNISLLPAMVVSST